MADREPFTVPEGWELVTKVDRKGKTIKYYTNVIGQRFYTEGDLLRNIKDSKEKGYGIYAPDFDASIYKASSSRNKKKSRAGKAIARIGKKEKQSTIKGAKTTMKGKEAETQTQEQAAPSTECRTSRRIARLEPELNSDLECTKALEYVIKDKSH